MESESPCEDGSVVRGGVNGCGLERPELCLDGAWYDRLGEEIDGEEYCGATNRSGVDGREYDRLGAEIEGATENDRDEPPPLDGGE